MYPQFLTLFRLPFDCERLEAMRLALVRMRNLHLSSPDRGYLELAQVVLAPDPGK